MWDKIEARILRYVGEKQAKAVRAYATVLARKRRCSVSDGLRLIQEYASKED